MLNLNGEKLREDDRMICCVSFDLDGTLLDFESAMRSSLAASVAEIRAAVPGPTSTALTVDHLIAIRDRVSREVQGVRTMEEIRLHAFGQALEEIGSPDPELAARLSTLYLDRRFRQIKPYPDALPALEVLAGEYRLGLASNGNSYPERCGLPNRFDFVVLSQELGISKPDPRFYRSVAEAAGVPLERIAHVGDSLRNDILPAQEVGLRTVWLNRGGTRKDAGIRPEAEILSLAELPEALEKFAR